VTRSPSPTGAVATDARRGLRSVGIIGTGAFAAVHAEAIGRHPELHLAGFAGKTAAAADAIAARYGVTAYRDARSIVDDDAIDAVIVATPHATHAELTALALRAGTHVLVEKPVAVSTAEALELIDIASSSRARAMVGHLMRWAPAHRQARLALETGEIGQVVAAESRRVIPWNARERQPWHAESHVGGGMWLVQGVHVLDQLRWLIGSHPVRAVGTAATMFHPAQSADDFGTALLDYGGVQAALTIAGVAHGPAEVYTDVYGTLGVLRVSHRGLLQIDTGSGWADRLQPVAGGHWEATLEGELDDLVRMIDGAEAATDLEYGLHVLATVEAVRRSELSGRWEAVA
jgi:predicted dehydrogenase